MAGTNRDALYGRPSGSRSFIFNSEQPTKTAVLTGVAVFCFLLFVRFGLQRGVAWMRQSRSRRFSHTQEQTRATPPILDEKMPQTSRCHSRPASQEPCSSTGDSDASTSFSAPSAVPERQQRRLLTRLPPPPPLTPPELSATIFACDEDVDGFMSQPNPDYMSATASMPFEDAQPTPRRRSYMKTFTIGTPMVASEDGAFPDSSFGPGAYPPSPSFSAPPPRSQSQMRAHEDDAPRHNVDVKGEIISVVNQDGEGWTRHTRVYGGGACLACTASGGQEGGFYGATVTPEEMRY
ncbi:hypothetical protein LMH87_000149 [Akanthomyces muscarius]|uniref:Uncharacterized protein n=1 Tax=Akanthomyces muscarius TaxID=2231603 RepID=A0A9W8QGQ4_AKAMU|nr:hypothetical protein LMH87_000149 [Akanthomyces muscarius]KAJ4154875.1 hypothetical protein LMH87_000149 [Akanthomyces muscarius]